MIDGGGAGEAGATGPHFRHFPCFLHVPVVARSPQPWV